MVDMKDHNLKEHPDHSVKCKLCQSAFMTREAMEKHLAAEHVRYPCIECFRKGEGILMPIDELHLHYLHEHPLCSIECGICRNRFQLGRTLVEHKRMFHDDPPLDPTIKCINCKRFTGVKKKLQAHNASVHGNGYPHECAFCGNVFKNSAKRDHHSNNTCELRD